MIVSDTDLHFILCYFHLSPRTLIVLSWSDFYKYDLFHFFFLRTQKSKIASIKKKEADVTIPHSDLPAQDFQNTNDVHSSIFQSVYVLESSHFARKCKVTYADAVTFSSQELSLWRYHNNYRGVTSSSQFLPNRLEEPQ